MRAALATTALLLQAACTVAAPFTGTAPVVPGLIKAGAFDTGGQGVTWNDLYWGTNGPRSRAGTNVNVDAASVVSYVSDGEWLSYSVNAAAAGVYSVSYSLSAAPPTTVPITVFLTREASCAGAQTGLYSNPAFSTGSYTTFKDSLATSTITLPAGVSLLRVCWVRASYLQFASFTITSTGSSPFEGVPAAVPGTISAGRFDVGGQGVAYNEVVVAGQPRIRANELVTGDALGLGWTTNGEWTRYSVKIATAGSYKVEYLLAGDTGPVPVAIKLVLNGDCATGAALAPYTSASFKTGSWTAAQPFAAASNAVLPAGDHRLTLCLDTIAGVNVMGVRLTAAAAPTPAPTPAPTTAKPTPVPTPVPTTAQPTVAPTPAPTTAKPTMAPTATPTAVPTPAPVVPKPLTSTAYNGTPSVVPGNIVATNFDAGGPGLAYNAKTTSNPKVRAGEQVEGAGGAVGYINNGDWVRYTVNVQTAGSYAVQYLLAGNPPAPNAQSIYMTLDLAGCAGPQLAPYTTSAFSTGTWSPAKAFAANAQVTLPSGSHTLTVCFPSSSWLNFFGVQLTAAVVVAPTPAPVAVLGTPFEGKAQVVPGFIRPERFDTGGQGKAYNDVTANSGAAVNGSPQIRPPEKVGSGGSGFVGFVETGEWIRYSVNVQTTGKYGINYQLAGAPPQAVTMQMHIVIDSSDCKGPAGAGYVSTTQFGTGSWIGGTAYGGGDVTLTAGAHTLTVCFDQVAWLNYGGVVLGAAGSGNTIPAFQQVQSIKEGSTASTSPETTPAYKDWPLRWSDEFTNPVLDLNKWGYSIGNACDLGFCGWGNNEQQSYQKSGVSIVGGALKLESRKEWSADGSPYISGKIVSRADRNYGAHYGRVEVRANVPAGQGLWPAIWMLPNAYGSNGIYGNWPASGEIDIAELVNDQKITYQTIHYGSTAKREMQSCGFSANSGTFANSYHTYAVEWAPWGQMKFYVDGILGCSMNQWFTTGANGAFPAPFNMQFYLILNLAVGGNWPGWVDDTQFSDGKRVAAFFDYVRTYSWPTGRRLDDGSYAVPESWELPEGWDVEKNAWMPGYGIPDRHLAAVCNPMPYPVDLAGKPAPWTLPTKDALTIGAEYFDNGGQGCSYYDTDPLLNRGNNDLRGTSGVDLVEYNNATNGVYVGWMAKGEWLTYTVFGAGDATYSVEVVATSPLGTGMFKILMDSTDCSITNNSTVAAHTGSVLIADRSVQAGALLDWRFYGAVVPIPAGVHTLTLCATGGDLNVDYLKFKLENLGDAGESPAGTVLYSGPTPKNLCLSKSCHDSGLDTALAAKMTADAIAEAHAGDANVQP